MTITVSCECEMTYRLPDRFAGKRCRCRECGDSIRVPAARAERAPAARTPVRKPDAPKKTRLKAIPSESLHQMAPLNLSESRHMDPPAARARIKKIKAEAKAPISAKKRAAAMGPGSESEIDEAERRGEKATDRVKKKKGDKLKKKKLKKRLEDRDLDRDDEDEEDRPKKKKKKKKGKKGKKAKKAERLQKKLLLAKKKRVEKDEDETEEDGEEAPRRDPRKAKRRQQLVLLGGSFGALLLVGLVFFLISNARASADAAVAKKGKDLHDAITVAQATATSGDIDKADKQYADVLALADDKAVPLPEDDNDLSNKLKLLGAQRKLFDKIKSARAKFAVDPASAAEEFFALTGYEDEVIRTTGIDGLVACKDPRAAEVCAKFVSSPAVSVKAAARKGLVECGGSQAQPVLAGIIREEGMSPLGKLAMDRALECGNNPNIDAILAVCDKSTDSQQLVGALKVLARMADPKGKAAAEKLSTHQDAAVAQEAQKTLTELKGFEKG